MSEQVATADLARRDRSGHSQLDTQFIQFGARRSSPARSPPSSASGHLLVKQTLSEPGNGGVLVVDGDASVHTALVGAIIAGRGVSNGWAGVIVNGAVRDSAILRTLDIVSMRWAPTRARAQTGSGEKTVPVSFAASPFTRVRRSTATTTASSVR